MAEKSFEDKLFEVLNSYQGKRILAFDFQGKIYWLKQAEQLCGVMRILKGNANKSLNREVCALCKMSNCDAPVPKVLFSQKFDPITRRQGFVVLEDSGLTIKQWLMELNIGDEKRKQILIDSSKALAGLHKMNLTHGRPALRDICWREGCITFIDFESKVGNSTLVNRKVRDLLLYIHSLFRYLGANESFVHEVVIAYRNAGGEVIWQQAKTFLSYWHWFLCISFVFRHRGGRDLKPIYWVLKHFREADEYQNIKK